jgi:hypothetical protein
MVYRLVRRPLSLGLLLQYNSAPSFLQVSSFEANQLIRILFGRQLGLEQFSKIVSEMIIKTNNADATI